MKNKLNFTVVYIEEFNVNVFILIYIYEFSLFLTERICHKFVYVLGIHT
jgi:hypothetical protein